MKRVEGVVVGLVKEVDAKLGRVKVKFPWMQPPQTSHWAPIASLLSGKSRGARFMPELDDEALVAFDRGEFDHPYIVGFLCNGADNAPDDVKSNRVVVTPGGHQLRFEDKEGDRRVVLKSAAGHTLTLDDKAKSVTLESTDGHEVEILDGSGTVTVRTKHGGKVTLDDLPGRVAVEASTNRITLGPEGVTVEVVAGSLSVKSTAVTNVEATGVVNVKSAAAMNIQSPGLVNVTAGFLNVTAPLATFSGVLQANMIVAATVAASTYSKGVGNLV